MAKTLYSLMLDADVVREIDLLAHRRGMNRSALVNQILAEYVSVTTPERRINDIFAAIESLMSPVSDLVPFFAPNQPTMSLKSSLEYKYRPTVKYEVELYRGGTESLGELSVIFRTQSRELIAAMTEFFKLWKRIEDAHLAPWLPGVTHALYDGRFVRSIARPGAYTAQRNYSSEDLAGAISDYIRLFDDALKGYLSGRYQAADVEQRYLAYRDGSQILI